MEGAEFPEDRQNRSPEKGNPSGITRNFVTRESKKTIFPRKIETSRREHCPKRNRQEISLGWLKERAIFLNLQT